MNTFFRLFAAISTACALAACGGVGSGNGPLPTLPHSSNHARHEMTTTRTDGSPCGKWSWSQNGDPQSVDYGACWDDGGSSISNCVIGCNSGYPTGGGYVGPWGAGGGGACLQDPSSCVAYPGGKAEPGKTCGAGGTVLGPSVGQVLDNAADTPPGTNPSESNEVNNNFYLTTGTGYGTSATTNTVFGIVSTTFNGEVWFTPELSLPLYGGEISIRIGTGVTSAKTVSASQTAQWIQNWINTNPSAPSAVKAGLQAVAAGLNSMGGSLNQNECYSGGSWNGTTTA